MSLKIKAAKATLQGLDNIVQRVSQMGKRESMKEINKRFMKDPDLYKRVMGHDLPKKFHKK